jgi:hypothetical protein
MTAMTNGMIWFDNDPQRQIGDKIRLAVQFYQQKYGRVPTVCSLNPQFEGLIQSGDRSLNYEFNGELSPDHIWIGFPRQSG